MNTGMPPPHVTDDHSGQRRRTRDATATVAINKDDTTQRRSDARADGAARRGPSRSVSQRTQTHLDTAAREACALEGELGAAGEAAAGRGHARQHRSVGRAEQQRRNRGDKGLHERNPSANNWHT